MLLAPLLAGNLTAQHPSIKIDFDYFGGSRPASETHEPGYYRWVPALSSSDTHLIDGIELTITHDDSAGGSSLGESWYKAGIQAPHYARLVSDALCVGNGNNGAAILLTLKGLPAGTHSLLTFHNTLDNGATNRFAEVNISVDGIPVIENLIPSNRALSSYDAQTSYITFEAKTHTPVVIRYASNTQSTANNRNLYINAICLNTPNLIKQARDPIPAHKDHHLDADNGSTTLQWSAATGATSHELYFGTDAEAVAHADRAASCFVGVLQTTTHAVHQLYSMERYYWRVDQVEADGTLTKGEVWSFQPRQLAFIGAEGYGQYARGGRGGKVVYVTNLNDSGPGSLREAVSNDIGPRTILFAVSGRIALRSRLTLNSNNVTIAGQTAPGKGICISRAPFGFSGADDGIMRFMRVRIGGGPTYDGTGMQGSDNSIFDHLSVSWSIDEAFSSRNGKNFTLQRTILSEALNDANHQNYPSGTRHGYAASIGGDIGSFHHNLLAHCDGRNWSLAGGLDGNGFYCGRLDIFNNVVYNWRGRTTDGGAHEVNFVNNYYKFGPAGSQTYALNAQWDGFPGTQRYYTNGNLVTTKFENLSNPRNGCRSDSSNPNPWSELPFFPSLATIHTAHAAYKQVLSDVGCTLPIADDTDLRVIRETLTGSFTYRGSKTNLPGLPDSEQDVGGWETYPELIRSENFDSDKDGLPNWWEELYGLNPHSAIGDFSDSNLDRNRDGFTELDYYLHWMATPHTEIAPHQSYTVDLTNYTKGFERSPIYSVRQPEGGSVTLQGAMATFTPNVGFAGITYFEFTVTDTQGDSMTRSFGVHVTGIPTHMEVPQAGISDLQVGPNPFTEFIAIRFGTTAGETGATVKLYDINGIAVRASTHETIFGQNRIAIPCSDLPEGIYFIELSCGNENRRAKLVKRTH